MTRYRVRVQFETDGPQIVGEWERRPTAERAFRKWIGSRPARPGLLIRLTQQDEEGPEVELDSWPPTEEQ
ncbi:hypothetical protein ACFYZ9_33920 [Streptomyces sp. NPDC001691]|uniref:hypothetical protein n=1 Tax=Streptomyces sp. NPDC001691 TaxID=3364600 RepID=UPI0036A85E33